MSILAELRPSGAFLTPIKSALLDSGLCDVEDRIMENRAFHVVLKKSGRRILIPADRSILETLTEHGVVVPSSCQGGICGTCETTVCGGQIEHRDFVLMADEQDAHNKMMICVSRAQSDELVLDI